MRDAYAGRPARELVVRPPPLLFWVMKVGSRPLRPRPQSTQLRKQASEDPRLHTNANNHQVSPQCRAVFERDRLAIDGRCSLA
jgi:hypothetical protein